MLDDQPLPLPPQPAVSLSPPRRSLTWLWFILSISSCLLLTVLLFAGGGYAWYSFAKGQGDQAIATSQSLSTAAAQRRSASVAAAQVTATAYGHTIQMAEAQVAATSQAVVAKDTAIPITQTARIDATQTAVAAEAFPPAGWHVLLEDPFDTNSNRWDIGSMTSDWGSIDQVIRDGAYYWSIDSSETDGFIQWSLVEASQPLDNFYLSVEMSQNAGAPGDVSGGFVFHLLNPENLYVFDANGSRQISLAVMKDNEWHYLLDWTYTSQLHRDGVNRLAMLAQGKHYKFFVNDVLVQELDDAQLTGGAVGVVAELYDDGEADFQFDNFKLYVP